MQLIKVKILKNKIPSQRTYIYRASNEIVVGENVVVPVGNSKATAIVVDINVSEADAGYPMCNIKEIIGKAENDESGECK